MRSDVAKFLAVARAEIGTTEVPRGSNNGPRVREYLAATWLGPGYPWCASFVSWCGLRALSLLGLTWLLKVSASCDVLLADARKRGILSRTPRVGSVFLVMASEYDAVHTGIVERVNGDGTLTTIEGNSNSDGAREGYAVVRNPKRRIQRAGRPPLRFIHWEDLKQAGKSAEIAPVIEKLAAPVGPRPWKVSVGDGKPVVAQLVQGKACVPVRALLEDEELFGKAATDKYLRFDNEDDALYWNGRIVPCLAFMQEGLAWAAVRPLCAALDLSVAVDETAKTIVIAPMVAHAIAEHSQA